MTDSKKIYPRTGDMQTVYLKNMITNPNIVVGDYTYIVYNPPNKKTVDLVGY